MNHLLETAIGFANEKFWLEQELRQIARDHGADVGDDEQVKLFSDYPSIGDLWIAHDANPSGDRPEDYRNGVCIR